MSHNAVPAVQRRRLARRAAHTRVHPLSPAAIVLAVPTLVLGAAVPAQASSIAHHEMKPASAFLAVQHSTVRPSEASVLGVARDGFTATSAAEMQAAAAAETSSGASVASLLTDPPYPNFSLDQVVQVALQYQGVPYAFGGADPSGFDCSGLVLYVYAQFGISLPHSVSGQAASGTAITREAALPGDIVIMTDGSHNGIYMGNGTFIDAPSEGRSVVVRPIYTDEYYIVRVGI